MVGMVVGTSCCTDRCSRMLYCALEKLLQHKAYDMSMVSLLELYCEFTSLVRSVIMVLIAFQKYKDWCDIGELTTTNVTNGTSHNKRNLRAGPLPISLQGLL